MTNEMIAFLNTATTAELLELNRAVVARIKYAQKMNQVRAGNQFTVGEIVSFISNNSYVTNIGNFRFTRATR